MGTIYDSVYNKIDFDKDSYARLTYDLESTLGIHNSNLPTNIPEGLYEFYAGFQPWKHPKTGEDVVKFTEYQEQMWEDKDKCNNILLLKGQKMGITTFGLLIDIWYILKHYAGYQCLILAQDADKAATHLNDLKEMIKTSIYSDYLIDEQAISELNAIEKKKKTKSSIIYLRNPKDPNFPSEIILGTILSAGRLISHKRIRRIHMSDIGIAAMTEERFNSSWTAAISRLSNTEGTILCETLPGGIRTPLYSVARKALDTIPVGQELKEGILYKGNEGFIIRRLSWRLAVKAGLITQEWIDNRKESNFATFQQYYEAIFLTGDSRFFDINRLNQTSEEAGEFFV